MIKYWSLTALLLLSGLLGRTDSQENVPNADEIKDRVSEILNNGEIDINQLNASAIPAIEQAKNLFNKKCDKNGGEGAYENVENAQKEMTQCLKTLLNVTELQAEMEKYKPTGDLDLVFKKYCRKTPILKKCVANFTAAVEPCLEPKERENKRIIQNITDSLLSFVCFKEGDRIALFISAEGPECLQSKQQQMEDCVNATFGTYVSAMNPDAGSLLNTFPSLILGRKECTDISTVQSCVVKELETCTDPTPANIVDSIFNFILRVTPCESLLSAESAASSDVRSSASRSVGYLLTPALIFLTLRFL